MSHLLYGAGRWRATRVLPLRVGCFGWDGIHIFLNEFYQVSMSSIVYGRQDVSYI